MLVFLPVSTYSYADSIDFILDNGGFSSASEMIAYDNYLFVTDEGASKVQIIDQTTLKAYNFGKSGMQDQSTTTPTHIVCDNNSIYLCIGNGNYIKKFNYKGEYQDFYHDSYLDNDVTKNFEKIGSLALDTYGNLYALNISSDSNNSRILKFFSNIVDGTETGSFKAISIDNLTIDDDSTILMSASSDYMFVCSSTKITVIDSRSFTVINTYSINVPHTDVKIDHLDNLYYLNGNTITKLLASEYASTETINLDKSYTHFAFNQVNGKVYFIDQDDNKIVNIDVTGIDHLSAFTKPREYLNQAELNTTKVQIATLTSGTIAYNYPYTLSSNISLNAGDWAIVLSTHTSNNSNFYYCLITNKKEYNLAVYIHKNHLNIIDDTITNLDGTNLLYNQAISSPLANIYKYPTSMLAEEGASSAIVYSLSSLNAGDKITATRYLKDYTDFSGYSFYEVKFADGSYGYINANSLVSYNTEKEPTKIKANATIVTSDEKDFVNLYTKQGDNYVLVRDFVLLNSTRVRLTSNYDKSAEYTEIKYVDNGTVKTAYVKTKFIQVDGISFEIIIAILLAVVCVILTLILVVVIRKNKKVAR